MGYLYIIRDESNIKVGITKYRPLHRLSQLQTGNPRKLELVKCWMTNEYKKLEQIIHGSLSPDHIRGEWFYLKEDSIKSVTNIINSLSLMKVEEYIY